MDRVLACRCLSHCPAETAGDLPELPVQILPFADAEPVQELVPAHLAKLVGGQVVTLFA